MLRHSHKHRVETEKLGMQENEKFQDYSVATDCNRMAVQCVCASIYCSKSTACDLCVSPRRVRDNDELSKSRHKTCQCVAVTFHNQIAVSRAGKSKEMFLRYLGAQNIIRKANGLLQCAFIERKCMQFGLNSTSVCINSLISRQLSVHETLLSDKTTTKVTFRATFRGFAEKWNGIWPTNAIHSSAFAETERIGSWRFAGRI